MAAYLPTAPYRGTRDFLPAQMSVRTQVFGRLYEVIERYGYQRYDGPILEPVEIYEAKTSREIVEQQLYTLVDVFGSDSPACEIEIFELIHDRMAGLGASPDMWVLRVSDRVLLSALIDRWEKFPPDQLGQQAAELGITDKQFQRLGEILGAGDEIFEVFDTSSENRRSLFGGGRYANLVGLFCAARIPGIGFGMGDVTLRPASRAGASPGRSAHQYPAGAPQAGQGTGPGRQVWRPHRSDHRAGRSGQRARSPCATW